ncbi:MAG: hypothetical protein LUE64_07275 [Candidatus Gastranaerophilales bacterium]|nr:hypothetical protein [Candidatus Gastranaerophilales bacterium]
MTFNPLKEKGIPLDKQLRNWEKVSGRPYKRETVDCYSRTRQILMNGIEIEAWNFKHNLLRISDDTELKRLIADTRNIETMQQITVNWMTPHNQSVLDTTLGYEQVAVDLTAWLAQNEPDEYVKETYDFGLLEDFDHLYRYAQFAKLIEGTEPDEILHYNTDVMFARPTQYHHNDNKLRIRKNYNKENASPQTKANILTLMAGEQQTHNFYAEHGFMYGSCELRSLYAEICSVEEEHVTMYETLVDPEETLLEKLLLREYMEVCCYHNCYKDEVCPNMKLVWEEFLAMEIEHLQIAAKLIEKHEKRDPVEIIGDKVYDTCHFTSQKDYVNNIAENEADKRLNVNNTWAKINELDENWASYKAQEELSGNGAPSETAVRLSIASMNSDVISLDSKLIKNRDKLLKRAIEPKMQAPNTVQADEYMMLIKSK